MNPSFALTLFPSLAAAISLAVLLIVILRVRQPAPAEPHEEWKDEVSTLAARIDILESEIRTAPDGPVRPGINLTKRTQALRQHRLGHQPETIAKSLDMTKAEVNLLLKLHQMAPR